MTIDFKTCKGCGNLCPMDDFIRKNYETEYCRECRQGCEVCGDWIGVCGGCEPEPNGTPDNYQTLGLEPLGRIA